MCNIQRKSIQILKDHENYMEINEKPEILKNQAGTEQKF